MATWAGQAQGARRTSSGDDHGGHLERFDFIIIGAGPAGEAAAYEARERGASVAVIDRDLFGGSAALGLHPLELEWGGPTRSLCRRTRWSGVGPPRLHDQPRGARRSRDDSRHVRGLRRRGPDRTAVAVADRVVEVHPRRRGTVPNLAARDGHRRGRLRPEGPAIEGIPKPIRTWTNVDATSTRELPGTASSFWAGDRRASSLRPSSRDLASRRPRPVPRTGSSPKDHPATGDAAREVPRRRRRGTPPGGGRRVSGRRPAPTGPRRRADDADHVDGPA